jgi:hypothetical protein
MPASVMRGPGGDGSESAGQSAGHAPPLRRHLATSCATTTPDPAATVCTRLGGPAGHEADRVAAASAGGLTDSEYLALFGRRPRTAGEAKISPWEWLADFLYVQWHPTQ